jgi:hypothetical protein
MALYYFRISERLAQVPEPLMPVFDAATGCKSRRTRARQEQQRLRHESKSLRVRPALADEREMRAGGGWSDGDSVLVRMDAPPLGTGQGPGRRQLQGGRREDTLALGAGRVARGRDVPAAKQKQRKY